MHDEAYDPRFPCLYRRGGIALMASGGSGRIRTDKLSLSEPEKARQHRRVKNAKEVHVSGRTLFFVLAFLSYLDAHAGGRTGGLLSPLNPPEESYILQVQFSPADRLLKASGVIRIKNSSEVVLEQIALGWADKAARRLIAREGSKSYELKGTSRDPQILLLQSPLGPGEEAEIGVEFEREMPELKDGNDLKLVNWHPRLWWGMRLMERTM
jgi:hypothetical protein